MRATIVIAVMVLAFLSGCDTTESLQIHDETVELVSERNSYFSDIDSLVTIEITNSTNSPLYYPNNGSINFQEVNYKGVVNSWELQDENDNLTINKIESGSSHLFIVEIRTLEKLLEGKNKLYNDEYWFRFTIDLFTDAGLSQKYEDQLLATDDTKFYDVSYLHSFTYPRNFNTGEAITVYLTDNYSHHQYVYLEHSDYVCRPKIERLNNGVWELYWAYDGVPQIAKGQMQMKNDLITASLVINEPGTYRTKWKYRYRYASKMNRTAYSDKFTVK